MNISDLNSSTNRKGKELSRSGFLKRLLGLGGLTLGLPWLGETKDRSQHHVQSDSAESYMLQNGYIMTMGPDGDIKNGDIWVENGIIKEVGRELDVPAGVKIIDMSGRVVMPGFVDTHTHMWLTQMRGLFQNSKSTAYFPLVEKLGREYTANDIYIGMYLAAVEALGAGITFSTPFFDNGRTPEFAEAALDALKEAGVRARFLYAGHDDQAADEPVNRVHVRQLANNWSDWSNSGLLTLGLGWRGVQPNPGSAVNNASIGDYRMAKDLGLPISVHARVTDGFGSISGLAEGGFLGTDLQLVHATGITPEYIGAVNNAGASISLTPVTEHRVGFGITRLQEFERTEHLSLGIDGNALGGSADMFQVMRLLALTESAESNDEFAVDPRRVLRMATIDGARALGIDDKIGSLETGKRADLQAVNLQQLNLGRFFNDDPASLMLYSAHPSNVEMVMVEGNIKKADYQLLDVDIDQTLEKAAESIESLQRRAGTSI